MLVLAINWGWSLLSVAKQAMTMQCDQGQTRGVGSTSGDDPCCYLGDCQLVGWLSSPLCPEGFHCIKRSVVPSDGCRVYKELNHHPPPPDTAVGGAILVQKMTVGPGGTVAMQGGTFCVPQVLRVTDPLSLLQAGLKPLSYGPGPPETH